MGSHIDINKTILSQLQIDGSNYEWGSDLFNKSIRLHPISFHTMASFVQMVNAFSEDQRRIPCTDSLEEKSFKKMQNYISKVL